MTTVDETARLTAEVRRLRRALEFYRDQWEGLDECVSGWNFPTPHLMADAGHIARAALEETK